MADFKYVAVDAQGKTQSGEVSAKDGKAARSALSKQRLTPLKVSPVGGSDKSKKSRSRLTGNSSAESDHLGKRKTLRKGSSKGEKIGLEFLKRLHELHGSGMPVADAVKLLNHRLSDPGQREIAGFLWKELAEGRTLSRAMRQLPQFFNESSTFVIEAGEATGNVTPILQKIIVHLEEKREIRSKVLGSMVYPVFVALVAFGVVLFFLFFLLPQIEEMLASLGGELNLMAQ